MSSSTRQSGAHSARARGFHHAAVFYGDGDQLLAGIVPAIRDALSANQAVLVALTARNARRLRPEIGADAERIRFLEMERVGANPARIIPVWREFVDANVSSDRSALGIGEPIWADRSADELVECQHHEALLNLAFREDPPWRLLCPYDTGALDDDVLEEARRSHPVLAEGTDERDSLGFSSEAKGEPFDGPLTPAPAEAPRIEFDAGRIPMVRKQVINRARAAGLGDERAADLALAVDELTSNSVRHGGGGGTLSLWKRDRRIVCEVRDAGAIEGPLIGRVRPRPDWIGGRGLWIVNQLCDLLQIRALPEGNLARVQMRIHPS